jgi:N-acetyl-anhydromuramyl-L-alanine amidase AmpD
MAGSSIIICEQPFDVGVKVVTWRDDPAYDAYTLHRTDNPSQVFPFQPAKGLGASAYRYRPRRLIGADRSLARLKQVIRQFVVHHDGCDSSKTCFQVLHNERGLSVHFLIDNDGTIYQTLDLVDCAFQAAGVNEVSIGVELANRGDAQRFPDAYHGRRDKLTCTIHGHQFLAFEYTKEQVESMIALGKALGRVFPNLPQSYPAGGDGEPLWSALADPREYQGYLGHYHVTDNKWDPGPFDFKHFISKIRGRMVFPVVLYGGEKPEIPEEDDEAIRKTDELYENNEVEGEGGYYPVGPLGESRLWHGGVHLRVERGTPIYAPFPGKVVAARMTDECAIGSRNFVLLKHDVPVGTATLRFWTLFFHLDDEYGGANTPAWYTKAQGQFAEDPISLNIDVAAGELIGHAGEAGPPGRFEGQVHFEVMAAEDLAEQVGDDFWQTIDGTGMGRFCNAKEVIDPIDKPSGGRKDGVLSRLEVLSFYRNDPKRADFRKLAVRHLSEWADRNDWAVVINNSRDFAKLPKPQRARMYQDQIQPVLWWTDDIGDAAELPSDKVVWNYHPITFLLWVRSKTKSATAQAKGLTSASDFQGKAAPSHILDDAEATEGFTDDEDMLFGDAAKKLELEDLVRGYSDEK